MSATRLDIDANKKAALMKQNMRGIANLLAEAPPKQDMARVHAEALIRDDHTVMAHEILKTECQILVEQVTTIENSSECPPNLARLISDIMFAAPRLGIAELSSARKQLRAKFGKPFKDRAMKNQDGIVNAKLVWYLSLEPLTQQTVDLYMSKICQQYDVDWTPPPEVVAMAHVVAMEPAVTGLEGSCDNSVVLAQEVTNSQGHDSFFAVPAPFAPGYRDPKKRTASGSNHRDNHDDDDYPPCVPPYNVHVAQ